MTAAIKPILAFRVETKELLHALNLASNIAEKRSLIAILGHIKIELAENQLLITATDQYLLLKQAIKVQGVVSGSIAVDLQVLNNIVRKIPTPQIDFEAQGDTNQLLLTTKSCCFKLNTLASDQFPADTPVADSSLTFQLKPSNLVDLIRYTQFAASNNETRYNLSGICLHTSQNGVTAVALDGHRLSLMNIKFDHEIQAFNIIIPRKTAYEITRIFQGESLDNQLVTITLNTQQIHLSYCNLSLSSKLIAAQFPNYSTIIPQAFKSQLTIDTNYFAAVIDRVTTVINEKLKLVQLKISEANMEILAYGEGKGEAVEVISVHNNPDALYHYRGETVDICFNPKYLIDIFTVIKEGELIMKFNDSNNPVAFTTETVTAALFAIMPIKSTYA